MCRDDFADGVSFTGIKVADYLDADGAIALPDGVTLTSYLDRNVAGLGDELAYRYLDYTRGDDPVVHELTWTQLGARLRAVGARLQQVCSPATAWRSWRPRATTTSWASSRPSTPA